MYGKPELFYEPLVQAVYNSSKPSGGVMRMRSASRSISATNSGTSVTMTSTMKNLANSTYDMIKAEINGEFVGGKQIIFDAKNGGVGIPENNPNLSPEVQAEADAVLEKIRLGEIVVSAEPTDVSAYN